MASRSSVELTEQFNSPVMRQLLDYWKGAKGERARPRYRDFELMDIYEIAPQVGVRMAVDGGRDFTCLFWGTKLVEAFGHDATGKLLSECYRPESVEIIRRRMLMAIEQEKPVRCMGVFDFVDTMVPKTYEAIWLALDDEDGAPAYAIAAVDFGYELTAADRAASQNQAALEAIVYTDDL